MRLNKKNIFLFDGIGAIVSLLMTGLVLPHFSNELGLSIDTLYVLAVFPFLYSIYSLSCYFFLTDIKKWMLSAIISGNALYCLISGGLIAFHSHITTWGVLLLSLEILVVLVVVAIEVQVLSKSFAAKT